MVFVFQDLGHSPAGSQGLLAAEQSVLGTGLPGSETKATFGFFTPYMKD